jgi:hypothetical protein
MSFKSFFVGNEMYGNISNINLGKKNTSKFEIPNVNFDDNRMFKIL